jgi:hypothetical protein
VHPCLSNDPSEPPKLESPVKVERKSVNAIEMGVEEDIGVAGVAHLFVSSNKPAEAKIKGFTGDVFSRNSKSDCDARLSWIEIKLLQPRKKNGKRSNTSEGDEEALLHLSKDIEESGILIRNIRRRDYNELKDHHAVHAFIRAAFLCSNY